MERDLDVLSALEVSWSDLCGVGPITKVKALFEWLVVEQ